MAADWEEDLRYQFANCLTATLFARAHGYSEPNPVLGGSSFMMSDKQQSRISSLITIERVIDRLQAQLCGRQYTPWSSSIFHDVVEYIQEKFGPAGIRTDMCVYAIFQYHKLGLLEISNDEVSFLWIETILHSDPEMLCELKDSNLERPLYLVPTVSQLERLKDVGRELYEVISRYLPFASPLMLCLHQQDIELTTYLLNAGALEAEQKAFEAATLDLSLPTTQQLYTLLQVTILTNNVELFTLLVDQGCKPSSRVLVPRPMTLLDFAITCCTPSVDDEIIDIIDPTHREWPVSVSVLKYIHEAHETEGVPDISNDNRSEALEKERAL